MTIDKKHDNIRLMNNKEKNKKITEEVIVPCLMRELGFTDFISLEDKEFEEEYDKGYGIDYIFMSDDGALPFQMRVLSNRWITIRKTSRGELAEYYTNNKKLDKMIGVLFDKETVDSTIFCCVHFIDKETYSIMLLNSKSLFNSLKDKSFDKYEARNPVDGNLYYGIPVEKLELLTEIRTEKYKQKYK